MNKNEMVEKLEELEASLEQASSLAHQIFGTVTQSEYTERIYFVMQDVKDKIEELEQ